MTTKKRATISIVGSVLLVISARITIEALGDFGILNAWILFPGGVIDLLMRGVHSDWGMSGEVVMLVVSSAVWSFVAFLILALFDRFIRRKKPNLESSVERSQRRTLDEQAR